MRRPHVYERSAPRQARDAYQEPDTDRAGAAREIAGRLPELLVKAEGAGLQMLVYLLRCALAEAERQARRTEE